MRQRLGPIGCERGEPLLLPAHLRQPVVPPAFQLRRDQTVGGIDGIVLALGQIGLVACLGQRQFRLPSRLGLVALPHVDGGQRRLHAERAKKPQHGVADSGIHAQPTERDAGPGAVVEMRAAAAVADAVTLGAAVMDMHAPAAVPAAQQAREQRIASADGASRHQAPAVGVVGDQPLVPLELLPANVALVVIGGSTRPSPRGRGGSRV